MTSRQVRHKSIYNDSHRKPSKLFRYILSPMLFFSPDGYLRELEKVWVDDIIVAALWKECMQKLVSEWTDFVLYVCPPITPLSPDCAHFDRGKSDSQQWCLLQMSHFPLSQALSSSLRTQAPRTHGSILLLLRLQVPSPWYLVSGASSRVYCSSGVTAIWWPRIPGVRWAAIL